MSKESGASTPGSQDDVFDSKASSAQLSRQNSEVGYASGNDGKDKENENPSNKDFAQPRSKLKQPENYRVRSSSRNRKQISN